MKQTLKEMPMINLISLMTILSFAMAFLVSQGAPLPKNLEEYRKPIWGSFLLLFMFGFAIMRSPSFAAKMGAPHDEGKKVSSTVGKSNEVLIEKEGTLSVDKTEEIKKLIYLNGVVFSNNFQYPGDEATRYMAFIDVTKANLVWLRHGTSTKIKAVFQLRRDFSSQLVSFNPNLDSQTCFRRGEEFDADVEIIAVQITGMGTPDVVINVIRK